MDPVVPKPVTACCVVGFLPRRPVLRIDNDSGIPVCHGDIATNDALTGALLSLPLAAHSTPALALAALTAGSIARLTGELAALATWNEAGEPCYAIGLVVREVTQLGRLPAGEAVASAG